MRCTSRHRIANLLFVDQPVGTGLSFTDNARRGLARSDDEVAEHFYIFLMNFLELHSRFVHVKGGKRVSRGIVFAGESHAGHYIPSIIELILRRNAEARGKQIVVTIKGAALGNPWIDPYSQYDVSDFALGAGLISFSQLNTLKEKEAQCHALLLLKRFNERVCTSLLDDVVDATSSAAAGHRKILPYDARKFEDPAQRFPPGHERVEEYMNRPDVSTLPSSLLCVRFGLIS